jgi:hypothetical protein
MRRVLSAGRAYVNYSAPTFRTSTACLARAKGPSLWALSLRCITFRTCTPEQSLDTALRYGDRWPLVPVVSRADSRKLEDLISQRDVLQRYRDFGEG